MRVALHGLGLLLLLLLAACLPPRVTPRAAGGPEQEALAYLGAWALGDLAAQRSALLAPVADFDAQHQQWRQGLGVESSRFEVLGVETDGQGAAVVTFRGTHLLRGLGPWEVQSRLDFVQHEGRWLLRWSPSVLHLQAQPGDVFERTRSWGPRADLLDVHGRRLTGVGEVIRIGVVPQRVVDRAAVAAVLQAQLGLEPARLEAALQAPGVPPDAFLPLVDVRPERYQQVRPALAPVPGIFFRKGSARLTPAEGFATHTLGRVGPVTAEALEALGFPYQAGDVVGLSGLERALERTLAGSPSGEVRLVRPSGEVHVLHLFAGEEGVPVPTTLRLEVQAAAEAALSGLSHPAALVAVDAASGGVVAIASRPLEESLHRALVGRYPPGSTFKVVTAEALLARGLQPQARVSCPAESRVGGKRFRNFEGEALGDITLLQAFAHSCNTTFVLQAAQLETEALEAAARRFGFGVAYSVGLPSPGASFPPPQDVVERVAAAIGQGRVLATPLHMASVAAAASTGRWRAPFLLPDGGEGVSEGLTPGAADALRTLMRAVVTEGTGQGAAVVPGLLGKTGTAEFGRAQPPQTHAWFIGVSGDLAFAVLVEGGGVGGRVAVPIALRFLKELSGLR